MKCRLSLTAVMERMSMTLLFVVASSPGWHYNAAATSTSATTPLSCTPVGSDTTPPSLVVPPTLVATVLLPAGASTLSPQILLKTRDDSCISNVSCHVRGYDSGVGVPSGWHTTDCVALDPSGLTSSTISFPLLLVPHCNDSTAVSPTVKVEGASNNNNNNKNNNNNNNSSDNKLHFWGSRLRLSLLFAEAVTIPFPQSQSLVDSFACSCTRGGVLVGSPIVTSVLPVSYPDYQNSVHVVRRLAVTISDVPSDAQCVLGLGEVRSYVGTTSLTIPSCGISFASAPFPALLLWSPSISTADALTIGSRKAIVMKNASSRLRALNIESNSSNTSAVLLFAGPAVRAQDPDLGEVALDIPSGAAVLKAALSLSNDSITIDSALGSGPSQKWKTRFVPYMHTRSMVHTDGGILCMLKSDGSGKCFIGPNVGGDAFTKARTLEALNAFVASERWLLLSLTGVSYGYGANCGITLSHELKCEVRSSGDSYYFEQTRPPTLSLDEGVWQMVSTFRYFSCGLTAAGSIFCFGCKPNQNHPSQPCASNVIESTPTRRADGHTWTFITVGYDHACALSSGGHMECWGCGSPTNNNTECDDGRGTPPTLPQGTIWLTARAYNDHTCGIDSSHTLHCFGNAFLTMHSLNSTTIPGGSGIYRFSSSTEFRGGVFLNGTARCWWSDWMNACTYWNGQATASDLGVVPGQDVQFLEMAESGSFTCGLLSNWSVFCGMPFPELDNPVGLYEGFNPGGLSMEGCGLQLINRSLTHTPGGTCGTLATRKYKVWNMDGTGILEGQQGLVRLSSIASSSVGKNLDHVIYTSHGSDRKGLCALRSEDGVIECFGLDSLDGSPYVPPLSPSDSLTSITTNADGNTVVCGVRPNGTAQCNIQVSVDTWTAESILPNGPEYHWEQISIGPKSFCGVSNGSVKCFVCQDHPATCDKRSMTFPSLVPNISEGLKWKKVQSQHPEVNCGLLSNGEVKCWSCGTTGCISEAALPMWLSPGFPRFHDGWGWKDLECDSSACCVFSHGGVVMCINTAITFYRLPPPPNGVGWGVSSDPVVIDNRATLGSDEQYRQYMSNVPSQYCGLSLWGGMYLACVSLQQAIAQGIRTEYWVAPADPYAIETTLQLTGFPDLVVRAMPGAAVRPQLVCADGVACFVVSGSAPQVHIAGFHFVLGAASRVIEVYNSATVTLENCTFESVADSLSGVLIAVTLSSIHLQDCVFEHITITPGSAVVRAIGSAVSIAATTFGSLSGASLLDMSTSRLTTALTDVQHISLPSSVAVVMLSDSLWVGSNLSISSVTSGAAVDSTSSMVWLTDVVISSVSGSSALRFRSDSYLALYTATLRNNTVETINSQGASLYIEHSSVMLQDVVLEDNSVTSSDSMTCGGAVACLACVATLASCRLEHNSAHNGGAVCLLAHDNTRATMTLEKTDVLRNDAAVRGGAVFMAGSSLILSNGSSMSHNVANLDGGGVFGQASSNLRPAVTTTTLTASIINNTVTRGGGGGCYLEGASSGVLQDLSSATSANVAQEGWAADLTDGPTSLSIDGPAPHMPFQLRETLSPGFTVSLVDSRNQTVRVADTYYNQSERNLRPLVSVALDQSQALSSSLLGTTQRVLGASGTVVFDDLQYSGTVESAVRLVFAAQIPNADLVLQQLRSIALVNITGCAAGFFISSGSCQACAPGRASSVPNAGSCAGCSPGSFANTTGLTLCFDCEAGRASETDAAIECLPCSSGRYANTSNSSGCLPCPAGTFGNASGLVKCYACPEGSGTESEGTIKCIACTKGRYQNSAGQCTDCPAGSYNDEEGLLSCTPCDVGSATELSASIACQDCFAGRYAGTMNTSRCAACPKGRFGNITGLKECFQCMSGLVADTTGLASCRECPTGSFAAANGEECQECPAGSYSSNPLWTACKPCEPGTFSSTNGSKQCTACAAGSASNATGATACQSCPRHSFSSRFIFSSLVRCIPCPWPQYTDSTSSIQCLTCGAGLYAAWNQLGDFTGCRKCPSTAQCENGRILRSAREYIVVNEETGVASVFECDPARCTDTGACSSDRLQPVEANPLCGMCAEGLYEWNGSCSECDGVLWGIISAYVLLALFITLLFVRISQRATGSLGVFIFFTQTVYLFISDTAVWSQWMSIFNVEPSRASGGTCLFPISQRDRTLVGLGFPALLFGWLHIIMAVHVLLSKLRVCIDKPQRVSAQQAIQAQENPVVPSVTAFQGAFKLCCYVRAAIALWVLTFNVVVRSVFEFLDCIKLEQGVELVRAYPAVHCNSSEWREIIPVMITVGAFCGLLVPCGLFFYVHHISRSGDMSELRYRKWVGLLYEPFEERVYYWKFVMIFRRAALLAAAVFLSQDPTAKWAVLTLLSLGIFALHLAIQPYAEYGDNVLETLTLLVLTMVAVVMSTVGDAEVLPHTHSTLLGLLVIMTVILLLFYVIMTKLRTKVKRIDALLRALTSSSNTAAPAGSGSRSDIGGSTTRQHISSSVVRLSGEDADADVELCALPASATNNAFGRDTSLSAISPSSVELLPPATVARRVSHEYVDQYVGGVISGSSSPNVVDVADADVDLDELADLCDNDDDGDGDKDAEDTSVSLRTGDRRDSELDEEEMHRAAVALGSGSRQSKQLGPGTDTGSRRGSAVSVGGGGGAGSRRGSLRAGSVRHEDGEVSLLEEQGTERPDTALDHNRGLGTAPPEQGAQPPSLPSSLPASAR